MVLGKDIHPSLQGPRQGLTPEPVGPRQGYTAACTVLGKHSHPGPQIESYWVRILVGSDVCYRGCTYTVLQTVQRPGLCSDVYGTVHYKEPLKLFDKSRA